MSKRLMRIVLLCLLLGSASIAHPSRAVAADPDFVFVEAVAGSEGAAEITIEITGSLYQQGAGTLVLGVALGIDQGGYKGGLVEAQDFLSVGTTIGTSDSFGGAHLSVATPVSLVYSFSGGGTLHSPISAGDRFNVVMFFPNGGITDSDFTLNVGIGSVTTTKTLGYGSKTLDVAESGDEGHSVAVNGLASGSQTHKESLASGIAGTIIDNCSYCFGNWTTPDGTSRDWEYPASESTFAPFHMFAGPKGDWTWTWEGDQFALLESSATYGAYFPAGDDWAMYRSGSGS